MQTSKISHALATLCLETMKIREASYDHAAADKAMEEDQAKEAAQRLSHPMNPYYNVVDFSSFYKLTLRQAAEQVCSKALAEPVCYLLAGYWNDIEIWAQETLGLSTPEPLMSSLGFEETIRPSTVAPAGEPE